jgi:dynein light chain 1, axonemal
LNGIEGCKKLRVLYCSNNRIKDFQGLLPCAALPLLEDVVFSGNPVEEKLSQDGTWVQEVTKRFPFVKKLDGKTVIREDVGGGDEEKV